MDILTKHIQETTVSPYPPFFYLANSYIIGQVQKEEGLREQGLLTLAQCSAQGP
jgi:hypothetical protein